ncbi:MAG: hypothetical protein EOL86_14185 [Deltaproteobacteria bacterium]|nr:hypothetical protein [Deltaproteobacteria bacterium]
MYNTKKNGLPTFQPEKCNPNTPKGGFIMDQNGNNYQVNSGTEKEIIINLYNDRLKNPTKSLVPAARKLNVSTTTVWRKLKKYSELGDSSFIHGNKGRTPINKKDLKPINEFIEENNLSGTNFATLERIISSRSDLTISSSCLRKRYLEEGVLSPLCTRKTRKNMKIKLEKKQKLRGALTANETDMLTALKDDKSFKEFYATKSRAKYMGERVELDASSHKWFKNSSRKYHLHLAIDDASGVVLGAWMDYEETLNAYFHVYEQILTDYGIPNSLRCDKRTCFTYAKNKSKVIDKSPSNDAIDAIHGSDTMTQFAYACHLIGTELTCCSDARFKPRVERLNRSIQGDLPAWLAMDKVEENLESINKYLKEIYIPYYNKTFAHTQFINYKTDKIQKIPNGFDPISEEQIKQRLVVIEKRKIHKGYDISYKNNKYRLLSQEGRLKCLPQGTSVSIIRTIDDADLYATDKDDNVYILEHIDFAKSYSKDYDPDKMKPKKKKERANKVPPFHPWSYDMQVKFKSKSKLMNNLAPIYNRATEKVCS